MRDTESGLDLLGARYLASSLGRFMSPDPGGAGAGAGNPQSWNMYAYVLNNPLKFKDPSGTTCVSTQTENSDGTASEGFADNGDGTGCEAAGVGYGFGTNPITSQQVNVNEKQGSWLDYLWATTFNRIPQDYSRDVPLNPFAQQLFKAIGQKISAYPAICGGGWYSYAGKELEAGLVGGFAGVITEHDSRSGTSKGALFEGSYGEGVVGGVGYIRSATGEQGTGLAFLGVGGKSKSLSGSVGIVGFGSDWTLGGVGVYADGFRAGSGGGLGSYVSITNLGDCH